MHEEQEGWWDGPVELVDAELIQQLDGHFYSLLVKG